VKKKRFFLIFACICIFCTACWDSKELDDLALITSIGIDKIKDQYVVTMQVVNPASISAEKGGGDQSPVVTFKTTGKSVSEALQKRTTLSDRENYTSQMKVLIIGESLAKEGVGDILDFFSRSRGTEPIFYICIAKGDTAQNILEVMTPLTQSPADLIYNSIKTQVKTKGAVIGNMMDDLVANISNEGEEAKLTGIEIIGSKEKGSEDNIKKLAPDAYLKINTIGVFKRDKLVGWLNEKESIGLNFVLDKIDKAYIRVFCPDLPQKRIVLEVLHSKTTVKSDRQQKQPLITLKVNTQLSINEIQCENLQINSPETIRTLNVIAQKEITKTIQSAINAAQKKYNSDVLEFGRAIYRNDLNYWVKNKHQWNQQLFKKTPTKIYNDVNITFTGTIHNANLRNTKE
jgi:spore germination protein KC